MVWSRTVIGQYYPEGANQCPDSSNGETKAGWLWEPIIYVLSHAKRNKMIMKKRFQKPKPDPT